MHPLTLLHRFQENVKMLLNDELARFHFVSLLDMIKTMWARAEEGHF